MNRQTPFVEQGGLPTREALQWGQSRLGPWRLLDDWAFSEAVTAVDFTGIDANEVLVVVQAVTLSVAGTRNVRVSVDNGATFLDQSGDYQNIPSDGELAAATSMPIHSTDSTAARSGIMHIRGLRNGHPMAFVQNRPATVLIETEDRINALRVYPGSGGNITGGSVTLLGR